MLIDDYILGFDVDELRLKCNDPENLIQRFTLQLSDQESRAGGGTGDSTSAAFEKRVCYGSIVMFDIPQGNLKL